MFAFFFLSSHFFPNEKLYNPGLLCAKLIVLFLNVLLFCCCNVELAAYHALFYISPLFVVFFSLAKRGEKQLSSEKCTKEMARDVSSYFAAGKQRQLLLAHVMTYIYPPCWVLIFSLQYYKSNDHHDSPFWLELLLARTVDALGTTIEKKTSWLVPSCFGPSYFGSAIGE
jgi:hypothetical protein